METRQNTSVSLVANGSHKFREEWLASVSRRQLQTSRMTVVKVGDIEFDRRQMIGWGPNGTIVLRGSLKGGQSVAVKRFITKQLKWNDKEFEHFQKEDHVNFLRVYHTATDLAGFTYLALELGTCNLSTYLNGKYKGPSLSSRSILMQVSQGLNHLHSFEIVHRRLKPTNVLITSHQPGQVTIKLAEFGLIVNSDDSWPCGDTETVQGWLAPEQIKNTGMNVSLTTAVDVFTLGCLFFCVLTGGQHPFGTPSYFRDQRALAGHYDLTPLDQQLPVAAVLIERMIQRMPDYRPSMEDILAQSKFWAMDF